MKAQEHLNKLIKDKDNLQERIGFVKAFLDKFPNLQIFIDRWNHQYFYSSLINPIADKVDFNTSCGCCRDCIVYARIYKEINGIKIYADHPQISIGQYDYSKCFIGNKDWEKCFKESNMNENIVKQVKKYIQIMESDTTEE